MILGAAVAVAAAEMDPAGGTGAGAGSRGRGEGDWTIAEEELEVGASLGQGAQGEVFRGRWRRHDGAVAIKRLDADMGGAAGGRRWHRWSGGWRSCGGWRRRARASTTCARETALPVACLPWVVVAVVVVVIECVIECAV